MKTSHLLWSVLLASALPLFTPAQTTADVSYASTDPALFGPHRGSFEITLGGNGISDKDADDTAGGLSGSFGYYLNDALEAVARQSLNYSNPDVGGAAWNGSTFLALDQHFLARGAFRPFAGVNLGRIYGDSVSDTWAAGLEAGVKFYVQPTTRSRFDKTDPFRAGRGRHRPCEW